MTTRLGVPHGGHESDDEWGEVFGGDADGPQIVVLKEGRHLSKDEVQRERRRGQSDLAD